MCDPLHFLGIFILTVQRCPLLNDLYEINAFIDWKNNGKLLIIYFSGTYEEILGKGQCTLLQINLAPIIEASFLKTRQCFTGVNIRPSNKIFIPCNSVGQIN